MNVAPRRAPARGSVLTAWILAAAAVAAQQPSPFLDDARATIDGTITNSDGTPVIGAVVQLRSLTDGRAVAQVRSSAQGTFAFDGVPAHEWVVEIVSERPRLMAVSGVLAVAGAATVTTDIRVNARAPWSADFFRNSASSAMTAAATMGITAVGSNGRPVSVR